jgi:plasmid stabilization system protein ParE
VSRQLLFRPEAAEELVDAHSWYEARIAGLGDEFLRAVEACLASIKRGPPLYPVIHKDIRRALLRKFPYGIFYIFNETEIVILACFHARRDPRKWKQRIEV